MSIIRVSFNMLMEIFVSTFFFLKITQCICSFPKQNQDTELLVPWKWLHSVSSLLFLFIVFQILVPHEKKSY